MKTTALLAIALFIGIIVFAILFRYEYMGQSLGFEIRADRWTGCVESWNNNQKTFVAMDKSCQ